jgi:hypothetical protein
MLGNPSKLKRGSVNLETPGFWKIDWYGDWGQVSRYFRPL